MSESKIYKEIPAGLSVIASAIKNQPNLFSVCLQIDIQGHCINLSTHRIEARDIDDAVHCFLYDHLAEKFN